MNRTIAAIAAFLAAFFLIAWFVAPAHAGPPKPSPAPQAVSSSDSYAKGGSANSNAAGGYAKSASDADSLSKSGAVSGSLSGATGGDSAGGAATSGTTSHNDVDALSLFLPPPVFTPPMPRPEVPEGCPAPTETQGARSIGWSFASSAESLRDNGPCVAITFSRMLWQRCQYGKAARAMDLGLKGFARSVDETWPVADAEALPNLTPEQCAILTAPRPVDTRPVIAYVPVLPPILEPRRPATKPRVCDRCARPQVVINNNVSAAAAAAAGARAGKP